MNKMQPMETAPKDRGILLRMKSEYREEPYEIFVVAKYANWIGRGYEEVWETGPGQCVMLRSRDLLGWYELPEE